MRLIILLITILIWSGPVQAFPNYAALYKASYGYLPACGACHDPDSWDLNRFGRDFSGKGRDLKALKAAENLDSDGDGGANGLEISARANPGDPQSTSKRPGPWLKDAGIHPPSKLLKAAFPGAAFSVLELKLEALQIQALSKQWGEALPDESLFPVLFAADKGGKREGYGAYLSADLPGRDGPSLFFICADPAGKLLRLKILEYRGSRGLSKEKAWKELLGRTAGEITGFQGIAGPADEVLSVKRTLARGLLMIRASEERGDR